MDHTEGVRDRFASSAEDFKPHPETRLVDVPCKVVDRGLATIAIVAGGRRHVIARSAIAEERDGLITVAAWLASELKLLTSDVCYTVADIVGRFGYRPEWYTRNRSLLEAAGFPPPVIPFGNPRFDPASVDAWFERYHPNRTAKPPTAVAALDAVSEEAEARGLLGEIYGGQP